MTNNLVHTKHYLDFLREVKERIRSAQYDALKKVNKELIDLYWDIGRIIVSRQGRYRWGRSVVANLAKDLRIEFAGVSGFSGSGLWRMRNFYMTYSTNAKLAPLVREIGWSHSTRSRRNYRRS